MINKLKYGQIKPNVATVPLIRLARDQKHPPCIKAYSAINKQGFSDNLSFFSFGGRQHTLILSHAQFYSISVKFILR